MFVFLSTGSEKLKFDFLQMRESKMRVRMKAVKVKMKLGMMKVKKKVMKMLVWMPFTKITWR